MTNGCNCGKSQYEILIISINWAGGIAPKGTFLVLVTSQTCHFFYEGLTTEVICMSPGTHPHWNNNVDWMGPLEAGSKGENNLHLFPANHVHFLPARVYHRYIDSGNIETDLSSQHVHAHQDAQ